MKTKIKTLIKVIFIMSLLIVLSCSDDKSTKPSNKLDPNLVLIEGGTFTMGRTTGEGQAYELPTHQVTLISYYISKYEVTQAEYQEVMETNPSYFSSPDYPVESVNWFDAVEYCNIKSIQDGLNPCYDTSDWSCDYSANGYRLPTEEEWEYAARGASNDPDYLYSGSNSIHDVAWINSGSTSPVGTKLPNQLGLYDMSGNVWEWCSDWFAYYSEDAQAEPEIHPGYYRAKRGGCFSNTSTYCRVANRGGNGPSGSDHSLGFRIARSLD